MESETISAGKEITVFETEFCKFGVAICYDMRFPELFRCMSAAGAGIVAVPAAFNMTTGPAHWHLTARARALDNQVYFAAVSPARNTRSSYVAYGHSLVADPWGKIIAEAGTSETILYAKIDLGYIGKVRNQLPLLKHLRNDLY
jgi:predicted amidohydrolase